jgi:hypothetical protein
VIRRVDALEAGVGTPVDGLAATQAAVECLAPTTYADGLRDNAGPTPLTAEHTSQMGSDDCNSNGLGPTWMGGHMTSA